MSPTPIRIFTDMLAAGTPFSFSRWNDGQWNMVLGKTEGTTGDGHAYAKVIGDHLTSILLSGPEYMMGMQNLSIKGKRGERVVSWVRKNLPSMKWYDADAIHHASMRGELRGLIDLLDKKRVVVLGPEHMRELPFCNGFVPIPPTDAFYARDELYDELGALLDDEPTIVSMSAGWTTNVLIDQLHKVHGGVHTFIDMGSVWDPYVGVFSRGYMKGREFTF